VSGTPATDLVRAIAAMREIADPPSSPPPSLDGWELANWYAERCGVLRSCGGQLADAAEQLLSRVIDGAP